MPTYMDESGESGSGYASSDCFHLAAVWFEGIEHAVACEKAVAAVRRAERKSPNYEFKSSHTPHDVKLAFYRAVASQQFKFVSCTVDKVAAAGRGEVTKELIIDTAAGRVADCLREFYLIAEECKGTPLKERVWVDHHTDRDGYIGRIESAFRGLRSERWPGSSLIKDVRPKDSKSDSLIQLADMVCGAVTRNHEGDREYARLISARRIESFVWP